MAVRYADFSMVQMVATRWVVNTHMFAVCQVAVQKSTTALGMYHLVFEANKSNISPLTMELDSWKTELEMDMDKEFLLSGIEHGFTILEEPTQPVTRAHCKNYKSATNSDVCDLVEDQIWTEIESGRYVICDSPPHIVSSLGAIMKKSGKVRLIHDCSQPFGYGLNTYARKSSFKYETVDTAVNLLPPNGYMSKIDLSNAYRCVPLHRSCFKYTGLYWRFSGESHDTFFTDTRLPFGASESPGIFQRPCRRICRDFGDVPSSILHH